MAAPAPVPMPGITEPAIAPAPAPSAAPIAVLPTACWVAGSVAQPPSARDATAADMSRRFIGSPSLGCPPGGKPMGHRGIALNQGNSLDGTGECSPAPPCNFNSGDGSAPPVS